MEISQQQIENLREGLLHAIKLHRDFVNEGKPDKALYWSGKAQGFSESLSILNVVAFTFIHFEAEREVL